MTDTGTASNPADPSLVNGGGLVALPTSPFRGERQRNRIVHPLYGTGAKVPLTVTIPAANGGQGTPTGVVGNMRTSVLRFWRVASRARRFSFLATLDGTNSGWNPGVGGTNATIAVPATDGAPYAGLAIANYGGDPLLYAADDGPNRKVDVYNRSFQRKTDLGPDAFVDPSEPKERDAPGLERGNAVWELPVWTGYQLALAVP